MAVGLLHREEFGGVAAGVGVRRRARRRKAGSGKSMEMELYANQVLTHPSLGNPTIVVLTDRTDLDDQLFDTFEASELLPEKPLQIGTRDELRDELANRADRRHPLHHAAEVRPDQGGAGERACRTRCCPTGATSSSSSTRRTAATTTTSTATPGTCATRCRTPRSSRSPARRSPTADREHPRRSSATTSTIYDLTRAVEDGATVPVYYETRLIPLDLPEDVDPETIDEQADEVTAGPGRLRARADPAGASPR